METTFSTTLVQLLVLPRLAYFCAVFAYDGLKSGVTLTHVGMRKGIIARIYGVFYLLFVLLSVALIPVFAKTILATDSDKMRQALLAAVSMPEVGLVFIGLFLLGLLIRESLLHFIRKRISRKKIRYIESSRRLSNFMLLLPLAVGIQASLGLPQWVYVGIYVFFIYFAPFTSPQEIKKAMSVPNVSAH